MVVCSDGGSSGSGGDPPRPNQLSARSWRLAMIRSLFASTCFQFDDTLLIPLSVYLCDYIASS